MSEVENDPVRQDPIREPALTGAVAQQPSQPPKPSTDSIWNRIKRHKVVEWTLAYVAFAYAVLHGVQMLRETFEWPLFVPRTTVVLLLVGVPVAAVLAWYHGHRAQHRISGVELSILVALFVLAGSMLWWVSRTSSTRVAASADQHMGSPIGDKSIAVLPFVDLSEKHDQEYFADGMAEEIINLLVKIPELKVMGRTSSFQFKGKTDDLRKIGTALGAAHVVEGSVRRSGDHVRVTAQLIDTRDGAHRWSETYDRDTGDVLKVQDEIAASLVRALQLEVASSVFAESRSSLRTAEANDSYLRGLHVRDRFDRRGFEESVADFRHALELDPAFVPAAEALASSLREMSVWGFVPPGTGFTQARAASEAALKLDPKSAVAHALLCAIDTEYDWDWSAAARECRAAESLAPHHPFVLTAAALQHEAVGEWSEAAYSIEAAGAADPLDPRVGDIAGEVYLRAGRVAEAEAALRLSLKISPTFVWDHVYLGTALLMEGRANEALAEMQQETAPGGQAAGLAVVYHALHREQDSDAALARLRAENAGDSALFIAEAYAVRGQKDEAFKWLDRAFSQKDDSLYSFKGDPLLKES